MSVWAFNGRKLSDAAGSCNEMLCEDGQFAGLGDPVALSADVEAVGTHFRQQVPIDFAHDPGG